MNLTIEQEAAVRDGAPVTVNVAGTDCVLVRKDIYFSLDPESSSEPWTVEEMNLLADEAEQIISRSEASQNSFFVRR